MASPDDAARGYATALVALVAAAGRQAEVDRDLPRVAELIATADIGRFLANPALSPAGKLAAVHDLLGDQTDSLVLRFVDLVVQLDAWRLLPAIVARYFDIVADNEGRTAGQLVSALPLTQVQHDAIERAVATRVGRTVRLLPSLDPKLLGGFRVQVGSFVFDGSIDQQLESVRSSLLGLNP